MIRFAAVVFLSGAALLGCNNADDQASPTIGLQGELTYASASPSDDGYLYETEGGVDVIDECNFAGADTVVLARVTHPPVAVKGCENGESESSLYPHWEVPIEVESLIAGRPLQQTGHMKVMMRDNVEPMVDEYILTPVLQADGENISRGMIFVSDGTLHAESRDSSQVIQIDLPTTVEELKSAIGAVYTTPEQSCSDRQPASRESYLDSVSRGTRVCEATPENELLPRASDVPGDD